MPTLARFLVNSEIKANLLVFVILFGALLWFIAGLPDDRGMTREEIGELRAEIVEHEAVLTAYAHDVAAGLVETEPGRSTFSRELLADTTLHDRVIRVEADEQGNVRFVIGGPWEGYDVGFALGREGVPLPEIRGELSLLGCWRYYVSD